jgi:catechol 2,3-dioxygenase-like lactoylglutathione lyase family enzyme
MIIAAHTIIYTTDAESDRAFCRDVLGFPSIDAGHGWLIFALPPSELAFHDSDHNGQHELYLMCDDLSATIVQLRSKGVEVSEVTQQRWGKLASFRLPGGGRVGIYEPSHPSPLKLAR